MYRPIKFSVLLIVATFLVALHAQQVTARDQQFARSIATITPQPSKTLPLYEGEIPNSKPAPNEERSIPFGGGFEKISSPTITTFLPGKAKANGAALIIFPGGGYVAEMYGYEGTSIGEIFQDRGVAAFVVKYRLPSDATMVNKSIGPLQDAQQALRVVRAHAAEWNIDPAKVGVIGFSAGGHLASTLGTHFDDNTVRPDFMILVYPVISMKTDIAHAGSRDALLGKNPPEELVHRFSNDEQVTDRTPPTLLLHASDDSLVDADNSVRFYEALHHHNVPAELIIFPVGNHGFFGIYKQDWMNPIFAWMTKNGWMKP
jgi:acetyl esterase/lipase